MSLAHYHADLVARQFPDPSATVGLGVPYVTSPLQQFGLGLIWFMTASGLFVLALRVYGRVKAGQFWWGMFFLVPQDGVRRGGLLTRKPNR